MKTFADELEVGDVVLEGGIHYRVTGVEVKNADGLQEIEVEKVIPQPRTVIWMIVAAVVAGFLTLCLMS